VVEALEGRSASSVFFVFDIVLNEVLQ
jgi:hypothetical protein